MLWRSSGSGQPQPVVACFFCCQRRLPVTPIALLATQICRWEWVRAGIFKVCKTQHQVEWDAPAKEAGGAEWTSVGNDVGVGARCKLQKAFQKGTAVSSTEQENALKFSVLLLRMLCLYFVHQRRVVIEGRAAAPVKTHTAILPGSGV